MDQYCAWFVDRSDCRSGTWALPRRKCAPEQNLSFSLSNLTIPTDAESVAYGKHRAETLCAGCHGADLSGVENFFNADPIGKVDSANLTASEGEIGREFASEEQFLNAIRTGVMPGGHNLDPEFMSWKDYRNLSDDELKAIFMYLHSLPRLTPYTG